MSMPNLDRPLTLESPQDVPDGAGGFSRIWLPLGELWAELRATSGRETASGTAPVSVNSVEIVVRGAPVGSLSRPRPEQRFREGTRIYRIVSVVEDDGRGQFLRCRTEEEVVT